MPPSERDGAIHQGIQGIIPAAADVSTGQMLRTALSSEDRAYADRFTRIALQTAELGLAVPTISRRSLSLFVCHKSLPAELTA